MTSLVDQSAARKGLIPFDHNWQRLQRDDIYRQRVFGTESGASEFIPKNDKRKLSLLSCVIYVVFVYLTVIFVWPRVPISVKFEVNQAIRSSLEQTTYEINPTPRYWDDIQSMQDLRSWLLYGFPTFVTPQVQGYNFPIGAIRFTLRRIQQDANTDLRFNSLAPTTWRNKNGIDLTTRSTDRDNTSAFGAYRDLDPLEGVAGGSWRDKGGFRCFGGELLDQIEEVAENVERDNVISMCKDWCEELVADSKPCRCWVLSGNFKCEFYYMPLSALQNYSTSTLSDTNTAVNPAELAPVARPAGAHMFWPRMLQFTYNYNQSGWFNTPGFIFYLRVHPQEDIVTAARLRSTVPMTQSQAVFRRIRDWMEGGLLSRGMVGLAIDFVTFNPNHEVFSWIQLKFQLEASGHVSKHLNVKSLRITKEDRQDRKSSIIQRDLNTAPDIFYTVIVVLYVVWELWELGERGMKYFYSGWNLLTVASLLLHICTLVSRYLYLSKAAFTERLKEELENRQAIENDPQGWPSTFEKQHLAYADFLLFSSVNLLFVWLQLAHYLNDIVPRIGVLVDTMYRSMTPIIFLVVIVADMFIGFVIWANLMFGKSVAAFKDMGTAMYSCTELLFGEVDPYYDLAPGYPISGILFFFLYMFIFVIVLQNLSKAIVLVSYDDASKQHERTKEQEENRKRAAESESSDYLAKKWKQMQVNVKRFFTRVDRSQTYDKSKVLRRHEEERKSHRKTSTCLYVMFTIMYIIMTFSQVQVYWSNTLTRSLASAIEIPTFIRRNPISGQLVYKNFSQIETREEVMSFLTQVLPKAMFNSSTGLFEGNPNPLKLYSSALPQRKVQLVVNNWNIIVGRTHPVRISTRFANMTPVGTSSVGTLVPPNAMIPASGSQITNVGRSFTPALQAAKLSQILNEPTRNFVEQYCPLDAGYGAEDAQDFNSFVCPISRDYIEAKSLLDNIVTSDFITNQTSTVVVDFVTYNGYAEAFLYVAIVFAFQPSGIITKDVSTATIRLDLYSGAGIFRFFLEIMILVFTCFYLGQSFSNMYKDVHEFRKESKDAKDGRPRPCHQKCLSVFRGVTLHFVLDPFNFLDLFSSVLTVVMMVMWYDIVLMKLRDFFFPEVPEWDDAALRSEWYSDSRVIFAFYGGGQRVKWFVRVCAINTVIVLLRLLKYLQIFPHVKMLFRTFARGVPDITYFIILMFVILMGYVLMGHQIFGSYIYDFHSIQASTIACFEMFLGTFNSAQLRGTDPFKYIFYTYSYVILFRYMLVNMFFAIVDKSFVEVEEERVEMERQMLESDRVKDPKSVTAVQPATSPTNVVKRMMNAAKKRLPLRATQTADSSSHASHAGHVDDDPPALGDADHVISATPSPSQGAAAPHDMVGSDQQLALADEAHDGHDEVTGDLREDVVKRVQTWKYLPPEMRGWAVETSSQINVRIDDWGKQRKDCEKKEQHDLDRILVDAESNIKDETHKKWESARAMRKELQKNELKKLKEIHQDQEALAWYIMKREAELKKLEQTKSKKQERFDEIVQAAKSLISSGDDDGGLKALEDRR